MPELTTERRLSKPERRDRILLELKLKPHVRIAELAAQFGVTAETIRRDVEDLSRTGQVRRAYGGASAPHPGSHRDLDARRRQLVAERERIGRHAAALVREGEAIMVDAGSTTIQLARFLAFSELRVTVVTNCLQIAMTLGQGHAATVILCPGDYLADEGAVVGPETLDFISRHHVDRCFLGASGLSELGVTEAVPGFDAVKKAMLRQSGSRHFLVDASKFGRSHLNLVAPLSGVGELVTDGPVDGPLAARLADAGARVTVALDR